MKLFKYLLALAILAATIPAFIERPHATGGLFDLGSHPGPSDMVYFRPDLLAPAQGTVYSSVANSLYKDLIVYWDMDETSGNRAAAFQTETLTLADNNTVGSAAGKIGNAADFEASNSESLSISDNPSLSTGDIDFTVALWYNAESAVVAGGYTLAGKRASFGGQAEYAVRWGFAANRFTFDTFENATTNLHSTEANSLGAPSTATWYLIIVWQDAAANTCNIQVNNGTVDSEAQIVTMSDSTALFRVGAWETTATGFTDGLIDAVMIWKRVLTASERAYLHNSGNGRAPL